MKLLQFLTLAMMMVMFTACQQDENVSNERTLTPAEAVGFRTPPDKIVVCHLNEDGVLEAREIPLPALEAHLGHGDILPDTDGDGFTASGACFGAGDDCDDTNASIYPGAMEIPDDGIDQDCNGADSTDLVCNCFSMQDLQNLYNYTPWPYGWWSDVPGCKAFPYDQLLELWITNVGQPAQNFNFSAQAGTINGSWFASSAKFNHLTGQFDLLCGGYTTQAIAEPCRQILDNFFNSLQITHPTWDYCVRFP